MIRPAAAGDAAELARIDALVSARPRPEQQFASAVEPILVTTVADQLCAFVVFSQVLDEATVINIAVDPAHQGLGLGRELLAAALDAMRDSGANRCLLEVRASNQAARALYEQAGFTVDGLRRNYYPTDDGREDALLMSTLL